MEEVEDSRRPDRSWERAISCSSFRWRREIRDSERERRVSIAGSSSSARERWAAWRVVEGVSSKCLVVLRTDFKRGKSDIPESSMEMLLSKVVREDRREATEEERSAEGLCVFISVDIMSNIIEGEKWSARVVNGQFGNDILL